MVKEGVGGFSSAKGEAPEGAPLLNGVDDFADELVGLLHGGAGFPGWGVIGEAVCLF